MYRHVLTSLPVVISIACLISLDSQRHLSSPGPHGPLGSKKSFEEPHQPPTAAPSQDEHPLAPVLDYAREVQLYAESTVRDYRCRLIKQERIDGELQPGRSIDVRVREAVSRDGQIAEPLSVFLEFHTPADIAGRKILFVAGQNDNKMLVNKGGQRLGYIVLQLDPLGFKARRESMVPVTELGFSQLLRGMVQLLERQIEADPTGANTRVQWTDEATTKGRPCEAIRIIHPREQPELGFHTADVYVDAELRLPTRIRACGWPEKLGDAAPLIADYTFSDLHINANLDNSSFDSQALHGQ